MAEPRMRVSVAEGSDVATIDFLPGSGVEGSLDFSAEQLATLIRALAQARARLAERAQAASRVEGQSPARPAIETAPIEAVIDPRWMVRPEALTEGSMLAFQHPTYGAVGFVLPAVEVEKMVRALSAHLGMVRSSEREVGKPS